MLPGSLRGVHPCGFARSRISLRLLFRFAEPASSSDFHLHPHNRAQLPLEATLLKTRAGLDDFVTEKYHDQIAAILSGWSAGFMGSAQELRAVEKSLASNFSGASFRPVESRLVHSSPAVEVRQNKFAGEPALARDAFLRDLQSAMDSFLAVITAEFLTSIDTESPTISTPGFPSRLRTRVRYELVGSGKDFYREQRVGCWDLEWESSAANEFRRRSWRLSDETRSRSSACLRRRYGRGVCRQCILFIPTVARLNFWASGSANCLEDLNLFNRMHARWAAQGLQLLTLKCRQSRGCCKGSLIRARQSPFISHRAENG